MPKDDDYDRAPTVIKWIAGAAVAVVLGAVAGLALTPQATGSTSGSPFVKLVGAIGHGSGVHIGDGYVLTAAHVAGDALSLSMVGTDGSTSQATLLWKNQQYDVALMRVNGGTELSSVDLDCSDLPVGSSVYAIGNPRDLVDIRISGKIAGANVGIGPWFEAAPVDMTVVGGMSGGAVMSMYDTVAGIVVGAMNLGDGVLDTDTVGIGVIVPSSVICMLMART